MKRLHILALALCLAVLLTAIAPAVYADEWNKKTIVTFSDRVEVPGAVLEPGKYVLKLVDSQADRHIVQVMNERENHVYNTILAIPKQRMEPADKTIISFYEIRGGGPEPIKSWFYPGDTIGQEFVYPKHRMTEILALMKQDNTVVASSSTTTSEAARSETVAENTVTEPVPVPEPAPTPVPTVTSDADRVVEEAPPAENPPAAKPEPAPEMPKTAGNTGAIALLSLLCLGIASSLRISRRLGSRS